MRRNPYRTRHLVLFIGLLLAVCLISHFIFEDIHNDPVLDKFPVARKPAQRHLNISIVMVVSDANEAEEEYKTALRSMRCYCNMHNYSFNLVQDVDYRESCHQKDFMFRRHCIVAELLKTADWLLFLDADIAIVNPNVLIEEYINPQYDLTFYDRFVNWEVAAGSYIVHNTEWAKSFLREFANFETQLPNSFHGTDNGALHIFFQQAFYPQLSDESHICRKIWEKAENFQDLFTFEACIRTVMGDVHEFERARILKKGTGWVRDIWLTDSKWSPERDFMLHGLKDSNEVKLKQGFFVNTIFGKFNWRSPFAATLKTEMCQSPKSPKWKMEKHLIVSKKEVEKYLCEQFDEVEKRRWESLSAVAKYI